MSPRNLTLAPASAPLGLLTCRRRLLGSNCCASMFTKLWVFRTLVDRYWNIWNFLVCLLILMSQRRGSPHGACATSHTGSRHLSRFVCVYFCAMRQMISCNSIHMIHVCARALAVRKMIELKDTTRVREEGASLAKCVTVQAFDFNRFI